MATSLELKVDLLTEKVDRLILMIEKLAPQKKEELDVNTWTVEEYKNSILIKFAFHAEFKDYIKELGGTWMVAKKAWMFPKSNYEDIIESIGTKFPKWSCINTVPV
jgi:hypothetical protein